MSAERHAPRPPPCLREPAGRKALAASSALHALPARMDETAAPEVRPLARLCATCRHGPRSDHQETSLFVAQCDDIDFARHQIHVRRSLEHGTLETPKSMRSRRAIDMAPTPPFSSYRPRGGLSRSMPTTSSTRSSRMPFRRAELALIAIIRVNSSPSCVWCCAEEEGAL